MRGFVTKLICSLFLISCFTACEKEEIIDGSAKESTFKTIDVEKAKVLFNELKNLNLSDSNRFIGKSSNVLFNDPNWNDYRLEDLSFTEAQIGIVDVLLNVENDFKSRLIFLQSSDGYYAAIEASQNTTYKLDGSIEDSEVFYFDFDGHYLDGYIVENGFVIQRLVKKKQTSEANLFSMFSFLFQEEPVCDEDVNPYSIFCQSDLEAVVIYVPKDDPVYNYFIDYTRPVKEIEADGSGGGGGAGDGTDEAPEECKGGKVKTQLLKFASVQKV